MNPFAKLSNMLKLGSTPSSVVGVDIGSSFVKAVQLKKKGSKAVLETYGELALGPLAGLEVGQATNLPAEKIVEAITDLFKEANITSRDVVFSIPLTATMLSVIQLPDLGQVKLDQMVPIEARKYIPTSISEVALNWWVIPKMNRVYKDPDKEAPKAESPMTDVLIAAIHNEAIAKFEAIKKGIGLSSALLEIEIFSSIRSVIGHDLTPIMTIDMGAGATKLAMIEYGVVRTSPHIINMGSQDITLALSKSLGITVADAEQLKRETGLSRKDVNGKNVNDIISLTLDNIFGEAKRVLVNYQKRYNKTVSKIILTGGGVLLKGLPAVATKNFEAEVVLGDPFSKIDAPAFLGSTLRENGPEFAVAIGLALKAMRGDK